MLFCWPQRITILVLHLFWVIPPLSGFGIEHNVLHFFLAQPSSVIHWLCKDNHIHQNKGGVTSHGYIQIPLRIKNNVEMQEAMVTRKYGNFWCAIGEILYNLEEFRATAHLDWHCCTNFFNDLISRCNDTGMPVVFPLIWSSLVQNSSCATSLNNLYNGIVAHLQIYSEPKASNKVT